MATALASALAKIPVRRDVAMTGEITLRGKVLAIGGLKEKLLAALRAGIFETILPRANEKDLSELPDNIKNAMKLHFVDTMDEVLALALDALYPPRCLQKPRPSPLSLRRKSPPTSPPRSKVSLDWQHGALAEGLACYRRQEFFLAHEHWEDVWRGSPSRRRHSCKR